MSDGTATTQTAGRNAQAQRGPEAGTAEKSDAPIANRLFWFVALWCAGVAMVGSVAWLIRSVLL